METVEWDPLTDVAMLSYVGKISLKFLLQDFFDKFSYTCRSKNFRNLKNGYQPRQLSLYEKNSALEYKLRVLMYPKNTIRNYMSHSQAP